MAIEEIQDSSETGEVVRDGGGGVYKGVEVGYGVFEIQGPNDFNDVLGTGDVPDVEELSVSTGLGPECDILLEEMLREASMNDGIVGLDPMKLTEAIAPLKDEAFMEDDEEEGDDRVEALEGEELKGIGKIIALSKRGVNKTLEWGRKVLKEFVTYEGESCHTKSRITRTKLLPRVGQLLDLMEQKGLIARRQLTLKGGRQVKVVLPSKNCISNILRKRA